VISFRQKFHPKFPILRPIFPQRLQYIEQIEYFQHARFEVATKKKQVLRQTRTLGGPNKRNGKLHRRNTKSGQRQLIRSGADSNDNSDESGSDSDNSGGGKQEIQLTAPVMHFLNAMVRKTTFNEAVVKESDQTLEDIKRRFDEEEKLNLAPSAKHRRMNRMGSMDGYNSANFQEYAATAADTANNATENAAPAAAAEAETDGNSLHSASSLKNSAPATGRGSTGSKDSGVVIPRRQSAFPSHGSSGMYHDMYPIQERRTSGFGSGPGSPEGTPHHQLFHGGSTPQLLTGRRKLLPEQMNQLKDAIRSFIPANDPVFDKEKERETPKHHHVHMHSHARDHFKAQVHRAYDLLLERTESSSIDEFLERFHEGQTLLNSLRKQQTLVDSRIMQLQSEHAELFATFSDLAFISDEGDNASLSGEGGSHTIVGPSNNTGSTANNTRPSTAESVQSQSQPHEVKPGSTAMDLVPGASDRYLDNRLFAHEVRMNQLLRNKDRTEQIVSDVRTAVTSLIHLMSINSRLLYALPRSEPPVIKSNDDIQAGVSWFEDRITALSEALAMDANKPTGANTGTFCCIFYFIVVSLCSTTWKYLPRHATLTFSS